MNDFSTFKSVRTKSNRQSDFVSNVSDVPVQDIQINTQADMQREETKTLNILWLYPDIMNIHGGRGDLMGLLNMSNHLGIPVEIRRVDRLEQEVDWNWAHIAYITAGELSSAPAVIEALNRQRKDIEDFVNKKRVLIASGSSGAILAKEIKYIDGKIVEGLALLNMSWTERSSVWGDDIWVKTGEDIEVIGNQIQVADVELDLEQKPFGELVYGRGNNGSIANEGSGLEGARTDNIIYTSILGPIMTKNPAFAADILIKAANQEEIGKGKELYSEIYGANSGIAAYIGDSDKFEMENKSAEFIKAFMKQKMK